MGHIERLSKVEKRLGKRYFHVKILNIHVKIILSKDYSTILF